MESLEELDALLERTESERNSSSNCASVEPKIEKQDKAEDVEVVRVKQERIIAENSGGQAEDVCSGDSESLTGSSQITPEQSMKHQPDDGTHHEEKLLSLLEKDAFEVANNKPEDISPTPFSRTFQIKDFAAFPSSSKESPSTGVVDKDEFQLDLEADLGAEYEDDRLNTLYELCSVEGGNKNWSSYPVFLRQFCVVRAPRLYCTICAVTITGGMPCIRAHLDGKKHKARLVSVQLAQETLQSTVSKLGLKPVFTVTQPYSESLEAAAEAKKKRFVPRQVGISAAASSTDTLAPTSNLSLLTQSLPTGVSFPVGVEYMAEVVGGGEEEVLQTVAPPSYICLLCQQESSELKVAVQHVQSTAHIWRYWQLHCPRACLKFAAKPGPQQWPPAAVAVMRKMVQRLETQLGRLQPSVVRRTAWQDHLSVVCQEILVRNTHQHWTEPPDLTFHDLPNPFPDVRGNRTQTVPVPLQANLKLEIGTEPPVFAPMEVDFKLDILGLRTTAVSESSLDLDDKEDIIQREIERFRSQHKVTLEGDSVVPMDKDKITLMSDSLKVKKDSIMARLAALKRENQPGDQGQAKRTKEEDDDVIVVLDTDSRSSSNRKRRRSRSRPRSNSRSRHHRRRRSRSYSRDRRHRSRSRSRSVSSISSLSSSSLSSARSRSKSRSGNRFASRRNNRSQRRSKTPPPFYRERNYKNAPKGGSSSDKAHKNALPPEYQPPQYMRDALPYPYDSEKGVALPKPAPTPPNVPSTPLVPSVSMQTRWNNMNRELSQLLQTLARKREFYGKQPEQHPRYATDWKQFWEAKYRSLRLEGKDADHYDYRPEWIVYWQRRLGELDDEFIREQKEQLKVKYRLTTPQAEAAPPPPPAAPSVGTKEAVLDPQSRKPVKIQWKRIGEVAESQPNDIAAVVAVCKAPPPPGQDMEVISSDEDEESLSDQGSKRASNALARPEVKGLTKVTPKGDLLQVLRMLTALEEHLGSLGPLVNTLLSRALALERTKGGGSAKELLGDTATIDLLDTAKEKLRGQVEAGILDRGKANAAQIVIETVTQLIEQASVAAKAPPNPSGTGVMVMAQQIAQVLQTQGQTSVADAKMQSIVASLLPSFTPPEQITAVVQALNTLLPSSAPVRTVVPSIPSTPVVEASNLVSTMELPSSRRGASAASVATLQLASGSAPLATDDLNADELRSLILNFRQLSPSQQKDLVAYLRKLEATQPERVRELRQCIAPNTPPVVPAAAPKPAKPPTLGRSVSPLSANRKGLASNPSPPPLAPSRREPKAASPKPRTSSISTLSLLRAGRPLNLDPDPQRRFTNDDKPVHPQRKVLNAEKPVLVGVGGSLAAAPTLSPAVWTLPSHQQQQQYAPPVQTYAYVPPTSAYSTAQPMQAYPSAPPVQTYLNAPPVQTYPNAPPVQTYSNVPPAHAYPDAPPTQMYPETPPMPGYPNTQPVHAYTNPPQTPMDPNYGHYMGGSYYTSQDPTYGRGNWPMQSSDLNRTRPPAPIHPNAPQYGYPPQSGYQQGYM